MKYLFPSLLLLLLTGCQKEEKVIVDREKTDWAFFKLQGDVKTISERSFTIINNQMTKGAPGHQTPSERDTDREFNDHGMLIKEKQIKINGETFEEATYSGKDTLLGKTQYMGNGIQKTQMMWDAQKNNTGVIRRNDKNLQIDRTAMKYKGDKLTEKISYGHEDLPIERIVYTYDAKGNRSAEELYNGTEIFQLKTLYKYYEDNKKASETRFTKDGKQLYITNYTYKGENLVKKETLGADNLPEFTETYTYNSKNKILSHTTFDPKIKEEAREDYTYDKNGNMTQWVYNKTHEPQVTAQYTYDKYNNLTGIKVLNDQQKVLDEKKFVFEYDNKGNWTKKTIYYASMPMYVVERTITYY
jgi:hypothetical protein